VDRVIHKPNIKTKHWETEAPSSEIIFQKNIKSFEEAWRVGRNLLIKSVEHHLTQKQPNLKLYIGIEYQVVKQRIDMEDQDPDDINMVGFSKPKDLAVKTKHVNVYSVGSVKQTILN
jgi:hypothetical protein